MKLLSIILLLTIINVNSIYAIEKNKKKEFLKEKEKILIKNKNILKQNIIEITKNIEKMYYILNNKSEYNKKYMNVSKKLYTINNILLKIKKSNIKYYLNITTELAIFQKNSLMLIHYLKNNNEITDINKKIYLKDLKNYKKISNKIITELL